MDFFDAAATAAPRHHCGAIELFLSAQIQVNSKRICIFCTLTYVLYQSQFYEIFSSAVCRARVVFAIFKNMDFDEESLFKKLA